MILLYITLLDLNLIPNLLEIKPIDNQIVGIILSNGKIRRSITARRSMERPVKRVCVNLGISAGLQYTWYPLGAVV
jgi:hypothetical protein